MCFEGYDGVLGATSGACGRKGVFGWCNGKCPGETLLVPETPFKNVNKMSKISKRANE